MTKDGEKVLILLRTLTDWMPQPASCLTRRDSGELATEKRTCHACGGRGTAGKRSNMPCAVCHGTSYELVDAYTRLAPDEGKAHRRADRIVPCDGCQGQGVHGNGKRCTHCDGTGTRLAPTSQDLHALEYTRRYDITDGAKADQYRKGSYHNLDQALARLEHEAPIHHNAIMCWVVYDQPIRLSRLARIQISIICDQLARWMPKPIRIPRGAGDHIPTRTNANGRHTDPLAQGQRDQQIHALRDQGLSYSKIAVRVNLTRQRVQQILAA